MFPRFRFARLRTRVKNRTMKIDTKILVLSVFTVSLFSCSSQPIDGNTSIEPVTNTSSVQDGDDLNRVQKEIADVDSELSATDSLIQDAQKRLSASKKVVGNARKNRISKAEADLNKYEEQKSKLEAKKLDLESEVWLLE